MAYVLRGRQQYSGTVSSTKTPPEPTYSLDGIEVVELAELDLDFVEEAFRDGTARTLDATNIEPAKSDDLAKLELFRGLSAEELAALAPRCQSINAVAGYVLLAPGRINNKLFIVIEGQLRLYAPTNDKRPIAVADVGQSTGLRSALAMQPANHAVIATEVSHILAVEIPTLDECAKRSHAFAQNYASLLASYLRGDNCLHTGTQAPGASARQGYIDELTLLHNEHWLNTMYPRLIARYTLGDKPLAVAAFAIDNLDQVIKDHGIGAGLRVLQTIGHWVIEQTRPTDILAINRQRHIFAFLPDCNLDAARQLASRLKELVTKVSVAITNVAKPITVTLSFGIVELPRGMNDKDFLVKAEALIQKSSKLGGNWLSESL
jgi:diguanylate cyclase (GGDEF)-like protein